MKRKRRTTKQRVELFHAHGGRCHMCGLLIMPGQEWEVSHPTPLELGGADDETNTAPAHKRCHRKFTAEVDIPAIAKSNRIRARHLGAETKSSRGFRGWRKFDGTPVFKDRT